MNQGIMNSEYSSRMKEVRRILRETASYTSEKIEEILHAEESGIDQRTMKAVINLERDISEDRRYCTLLGVDYNNLTGNDLQRIRVTALYLDRKYPDHVLPLI